MCLPVTAEARPGGSRRAWGGGGGVYIPQTGLIHLNLGLRGGWSQRGPPCLWGAPAVTCLAPSPGRHLMRQIHDELCEPDGGPGRGAPLRPEPCHRSLVQQLIQHQGHTVPTGEWGREEAWPARCPTTSGWPGDTSYDCRISRIISYSSSQNGGNADFSSPPDPVIFLFSDIVFNLEKGAAFFLGTG